MSKNPWNERYNSDEFYYGTEPNSFLVENNKLFKKYSRVLCLAEGEGRNAVYLASLGCEVTAVDQSEVGLQKLEKLALSKNVKVQTIQADLNDFIIAKNSWDFIISIWCHLPSKLRTQVHQKVNQGLNPNGHFILEAYTPAQIQLATGGPKDPDFLPTLEELKKELLGLNFILGEEKNRMITEGKGHHGMSAVVQLIGKK